MEEMAGEGRSDRAIKAYAYLTASFRSRDDVANVLDCIVPFVSAVALKDTTKPIVPAEIAQSLADYGLKIPLYALSQLLPRLAKKGLLEWSQMAKAYLPVADAIKTQTGSVDLNEDFADLEQKISGFAKTLDMAAPPFSSSWTDALIAFLKSEKIKSGLKSVIHKKAIVSEFSDIESFIIARFIQASHGLDEGAFDKISRVYTGVLIEDFIVNVQSIGDGRDFKGLNVFYDTPVLLRLLGTSGNLLRTATLEMHDNLRELGCNLYYFEVNRTEASNILDTIVSAHGLGHEIYGETAEAIMSGEIDIPAIRDLIGTFETRLGQLNIFPFDYNYSAKKIEDAFQIDEMGFVAALESAALAADRSYKKENAVNDANAVALILRLRKGVSNRDLAKSRFVFISRNNLLQRVARKFCIEHLQEYDLSTTGPVLTLGQVTTAGWLATGKTLEAHKVGQELLANCYAAVKPSASWADEYAKAVAEFSKEDKAVIAERADALVILKATRDAARDESLNEAAILRKINVAETFRRAKAAADIAEQARIDQLTRHHNESEQRMNAALAEAQIKHDRQAQANLSHAIEAERRRVGDEIARSRQSLNEDKAQKISAFVVRLSQCLILVSFLAILIADKFNPFKEGSLGNWAIAALALTVTAIATADLVGLRPVARLMDAIRSAVAVRILVFLA